MNIIYSHRTQGKGVEQTHINGIIKSFLRMGHDVDVLCPIVSSGNKSKDELSKAAIKLPEIIFEFFEVFYNFIAWIKIVNISKKKRHHFIYERYAFFLIATVFFAKKNKIPFMLEVNYTSLNPLVRKRTKILLPLAKYVEKRLFDLADGIFVVSSFLKDQLIEMGVPEEKICVTPNAVDEDIFQNKLECADMEKNRTNGEKTIGFVGGFYPWHGVDLLFEAIKILEKEKEALSLILIGEGPMKEKLEKLSRDLKSKVIFTGFVEAIELPKFIMKMDICVMPNSNNYGSPMKIFEYMALGKPVVAPKLGPIEDVINDRENGFLFEPGNIIRLSECLKELLNDINLRNRIARNAKQKIFKRHLWRHNADKIISFVRKCENSEK
ncbi:MAG: glycosyltransferase family 4 protein [Candidatus Omnitrophota bacterium]